jgi:hypothetical protein
VSFFWDCNFYKPNVILLIVTDAAEMDTLDDDVNMADPTAGAQDPVSEDDALVLHLA